MKSLLRQPALWLALLAAFSFWNAYASHGFVAVSQPDSNSYQELFDWSSVQAVLSSERTPGYPLFMRLVGAVSSSSHTVPIAHWFALILACLVFYYGVTRAGYRRSSAVFAAGALMFSPAVLKWGQFITADSLAISLSIASAGFFFATLASPSPSIAWTGLTLTTFAAYLTRPAYLFLIPLWPLVAVAVDRAILRRESRWWEIMGRSLKYAAATVLPFVAYALWRLIVVGHFGLVSFGGYNFIGIVGQFLEPADVPKLSPELQPFAEEMLREREELPDWEPPNSFLAMERMYNKTVWNLAVPLAEIRHADNPVAVNAMLSQLGKELLWLHPREYARWLAWNGWHGAAYIVQLTALDRGTLLLMIVLIVAHAVALRRGPAPSDVKPAEEAKVNQRRFTELHLILWTALAFAAAGALLVILVEVANDRYMTGAMTLLPAALGVLAAEYFARVFPAWRAMDRRESIQKT